MRNDAKPLWDIPTRIFHWSIVCAIPLAWWSAHEQRFDLHRWVGYAVLVLVTSRVVWGFVGSRHSRFSDFLVGPGKIIAYVRGRGAPVVGHNPLGGWSVVVLLTLLLMQAVSGLFNSDDIFFSGPLYFWASTEFRDTMGVVHEVAFNALLGFVALHVCAVFYHQLRLKEKLIQAMLRGRAAGREGIERPRAWWWALSIVLLVALGLWWGLAQAPQPPPLNW
jgi:cytochrome b